MESGGTLVKKGRKMQTFKEYRKEFLEDTLATEESEANGTVASFVKICALKLFEGDIIPEYTPCYFHGAGYRKTIVHVDGYAYDESDGAFYALTAVYTGADESETMIGSDARIALDRCRAFISNSIEHDLASRIEISTEAYDMASLIQDQAEYISKFVIILLTDMTLSERANLGETNNKQKKRKSKRIGVLEAEDISGIDVEYRIWDMPRFYRIFGVGDGHEEIAIDFNDYLPGGIPCLSANYTNDNNHCKSFLCTVPGNVIADLYDEYGSRMLEGNVRSFLGKRGVNKEIRNTVLNEPDMFFVYNNGLSATTTEAVVEGDRLLFARDLQIVNGGQTTATLSSTRHSNGADLSCISVLMKLTEVPSETAATIVPIISRSANSQNKVNKADFFSTHEYHIRMEQMSRREFAPARSGAQHETHWFYERARGQYTQATMKLTKAQERKFVTQNPKEQVVTKTDLAKVLSAWDMYPNIVSKGAESNFSEFAKRTEAEWEKRKDDFNINYFHESIALVIIYRSIDKMIPKQPWYEGGYKANIVAYTTALLHYMINKRYPGETLDLNKIWQKQQCPDLLMQQLTIMAEKVYYCITSEDRIVQNVTQWCKQVACWERVKLLNITPIAGFESLLQGNEAVVAVKKEARNIRKLDNTIDDQTQVLELGEEYWKQLDIWLRSHRIATATELKAMKYATTISLGNFPSDSQCKNLVKLRKRAIQEGFPKSIK